MTTFVESWQSLNAWTAITQPTAWTPQGGLVLAVAQSSALRSRQQWDHTRPWSMSWTMRARAETPNAQYGYSQFWASGGWLVTDDGAGANYFTAVVEQQVPPQYGGPYLTVLGGGFATTFGAYVPWTYRALQLDFKPEKQQTWLSVDGRLEKKFKVRPLAPFRATLLCVSVGSGVSDDGSSARAEFGPVTITGTPL